MIVFTNACVKPGTMVVIATYTTTAFFTVMCT